MNPSQTFAAELLANLVALGVKDFYIAPGARSQALAIALSQLADANKISLTVRIDERSLGFTALGRSLATGSPVGVITTSGTAVANLHPAVLEAFHAGVPLILLTSDRPARLRGLGANQTTNQNQIFGELVTCIDVAAPSENFAPSGADLAATAIDLALGGSRPAPVQLNLQFEEPLSAALPNAALLKPTATPASYVAGVQSAEVEVDNHTVVIAGAGAGPEAVRFAEQARLPLFAEPSSGARFGSNVIVNYPELLKGELAEQVKRVVVFGKPSLSRSVMKTIKMSEHYVVRSNYEPFNVFGKARMIVDQVVPVGIAENSWLESWKQPVASDYRAEFVCEVWDSMTDQSLLFGASDLIRVAESSVSPKEVEVYANRGLAGIDGTISTAIGIAQAGKKVKALIGDVTLIHEISGLNLTGLKGLNIQLIVGNDQGGHIFDRLEMRDHVSASWFEALFTTPQTVDLESVISGFGWQYLAPKNIAELKTALEATGLVVIDYQLKA